MDDILATTPSLKSLESVSLKHYEKLVAELRCPGCSTPMKCPIRLCKSGHSVCEDCIKMLNSCPLCMEEFTLTRNLTLEAVCSKAEFSCENSINGCRFRCSIALLDWHEKQCVYRLVNCFIGKVWGTCEWKGREKDWLDHINRKHLDKVFTFNPTELTSHIRNDLKPLTAYYIFQMYDQVFSFYQIFDKINNRVLWTMSYKPREESKLNYFFEVEIYDSKNPLKVICQRFECHRNGDKDILRDGSCATLTIGEILRFVDEGKVLHYRVRIHKTNNIKEKRLPTLEKKLPNNFQEVSIEGVNHKQVSSSIIIRKKSEEVDRSSDLQENVETIERLSSSDSESDLELEEFVNRLFKRRLEMNSNMIAPPSTRDIIKKRKQDIIRNFSKSYKGIKTGLSDLKKKLGKDVMEDDL